MDHFIRELSLLSRVTVWNIKWVSVQSSFYEYILFSPFSSRCLCLVILLNSTNEILQTLAFKTKSNTEIKYILIVFRIDSSIFANGKELSINEILWKWLLVLIFFFYRRINLVQYKIHYSAIPTDAVTLMSPAKVFKFLFFCIQILFSSYDTIRQSERQKQRDAIPQHFVALGATSTPDEEIQRSNDIAPSQISLDYDWKQLQRYALIGCFVTGPILHGW